MPTDPDIIALLSSSSPISPVASPNQQPNPLVDKFLQSLTNTPIQFIDHPATSRQESGVNIFLPSLCGSKAQPTKTQSEESQSNPFLLGRSRSNSTALGTSTQDARASLSRPNRFQRKQQFFKQQRKESFFWHCNFVKRPRYNPYFHYQLTKAFSSWEIVFWNHKRQEYTIQNTVLSSQRLVVTLSAIEVQSVDWHWIHTHPNSNQRPAHVYLQFIALSCWQKWMHQLHKISLILLFRPKVLKLLRILIPYSSREAASINQSSKPS